MSDPKEEEWRPVKGYEGLYEVSNLGRVKSLPKSWHLGHELGREKRLYSKGETIMHPATHKRNPKPSLLLLKDRHVRYANVGNLVAEAFLPKEEGKDYVKYKNGDRTDCRAENLEWCTFSGTLDWRSRRRHQPLIDAAKKAEIPPELRSMIDYHVRLCRWRETLRLLPPDVPVQIQFKTRQEMGRMRNAIWSMNLKSGEDMYFYMRCENEEKMTAYLIATPRNKNQEEG